MKGGMSREDKFLQLQLNKLNYRSLERKIEEDPHLIRFINTPDSELVKVAIRKEPEVIKYFQRSVQRRNRDWLELAVKTKPSTIRFCKEQDIDLALIAVNKQGSLLYYIDNHLRLDDVNMAAVKNDPFAITYVPHHKLNTDVICMALKQDGGLAVELSNIVTLSHEEKIVAIKSKPSVVFNIDCDVQELLYAGLCFIKNLIKKGH